MKKRTRKRILSCVLIFVMMLGSFSVVFGEEETEVGYYVEEYYFVNEAYWDSLTPNFSEWNILDEWNLDFESIDDYMDISPMSTFVPRTTAPDRNDHRFSTSNPFHQAGFGMPNCTTYAWGRAWEILGRAPNELNRGNARFWFSNNGGFPQPGDNFQRGQTPRLGAIAVWASSSAGHVAVVEHVHPNGNVDLSESFWNGLFFRYTQNVNVRTYLSNFLGFIYLLPEVLQTPPTITTTSLPHGRNGVRYSYTLRATGTAPITWSIVPETGSLPTHLTLNPQTGLISGDLTEWCSGVWHFTVRAQNAVGYTLRHFTLTVEAPPTITTTSLPNGRNGVGYSYTLRAIGTWPITWSIVPETGSLPTHLTLNQQTGLISGSLTAWCSGVWHFTVRAQNAVGYTLRHFTLTVESPPVFVGSMDGISDAIGIEWNRTSDVIGSHPITFSIVTGELPSGLSLNTSTGIISGIPTRTGMFEFSLRASNAFGTVTTPASIIIRPRITHIGPLPRGMVGIAYNFIFHADSDVPVTWSILPSSNLPPGLNINANTGEITGIPTNSGTFSVGVAAISIIDDSVWTFAIRYITIDPASAYNSTDGIARFHFDGRVVELPIVDGRIEGQIPTPATRYGRIGTPGQVFMGWFTVANPVHTVNAPNRATAFDLDTEITAAMLVTDGQGRSVFNLHGSWLSFGDVNGDGRVDIRDFNVLQAFFSGLLEVDDIIMKTADVNADGRVLINDLAMLQGFFVGLPVILGIPEPQ